MKTEIKSLLVFHTTYDVQKEREVRERVESNRSQDNNIIMWWLSKSFNGKGVSFFTGPTHRVLDACLRYTFLWTCSNKMDCLLSKLWLAIPCIHWKARMYSSFIHMAVIYFSLRRATCLAFKFCCHINDVFDRSQAILRSRHMMICISKKIEMYWWCDNFFDKTSPHEKWKFHQMKPQLTCPRVWQIYRPQITHNECIIFGSSNKLYYIRHFLIF